MRVTQQIKDELLAWVVTGNDKIPYQVVSEWIERMERIEQELEELRAKYNPGCPFCGHLGYELHSEPTEEGYLCYQCESCLHTWEARSEDDPYWNNIEDRAHHPIVKMLIDEDVSKELKKVLSGEYDSSKMDTLDTREEIEAWLRSICKGDEEDG